MASGRSKVGAGVQGRFSSRLAAASQPRVFFQGQNRRGEIGELERLLQPVLMISDLVLPLRPCFFRSPFPTVPMILIIDLPLDCAGGCHFSFQLLNQSFGASDPLLRVPQYAVLSPHLSDRFLQLTLTVAPLPLVLQLKDLPGLLLRLLLPGYGNGLCH